MNICIVLYFVKKRLKFLEQLQCCLLFEGAPRGESKILIMIHLDSKVVESNSLVVVLDFARGA